jgi:uncharacterized protein (DUF952 family)
MRRIYHIIPRSTWNPASREPYRADSLATEGFIHCSNRDQVARVANLFFADQAELEVLCLDADLLGDLVRDEDPGVGERFPHVYGPIPREAILEVQPLHRDASNHWIFPEA